MARCQQEKTTYGAALSAAFLKGVANLKELKDKKLDSFSFTRYILPLAYIVWVIHWLGGGSGIVGLTCI